MQPAIPISIPISAQVEKETLGKTIRDIACENDYKGQYQLATVTFDRAPEMIGQTVVRANSNFIHTGNGLLAEFGYEGRGGIRYFKNGERTETRNKNSPKTGGFIVKFIFDDGCLAVALNSWTCRFQVRAADAQSGYPFQTKYPLDLTDKADFTLDRFKGWLGKNQKSAILEACASAKGAFDVSIAFMNYILWQSGVHPKTKVFLLDEDEIGRIYRNAAALVREYQSGARICAHTDLYGVPHSANNEDLTLMTSKGCGTPCPKCGAPIDFVSGAGTKLYFCPACQQYRDKERR